MRTGQVRAAYLGAGVYVRFEPGRMVLTTENGTAGTNTIVFEPDTWQQLLHVVQQYHDQEWPFTEP